MARNSSGFSAFIAVAALTAAVAVSAMDTGLGRRVGAVVEIDPVSAVAGSIEVRSLPTQEGETGNIEIRDARSGRMLGKGSIAADGFYSIRLKRPLVAGQLIYAINSRRNFLSSGVKVSPQAAPVIDQPVIDAATLVQGRAAPGHRVQIVDSATGDVLGTAEAAVGSDGYFAVETPPLPLFHTIEAVDVSTEPFSHSAPVTILGLEGGVGAPGRGCSSAAAPSTAAGFSAQRFLCQLPFPRGLAVAPDGRLLVLAGAPPSGLIVQPPFGVFSMSPNGSALAVWTPVNGVTLRLAPGGAFGNGLYIARPRLFHLRQQIVFERGDGEIIAADLESREAAPYARVLQAAPTGMVFDTSPGRSFGGNLIVSSLFGDALVRIRPDQTASVLFSGAAVRGLQGLAVGPGGAFGTDLYAAQPGSGRILRIGANGAVAVFAANFVSPIDLAFAPDGSPEGLYLSDAGSGNVVRLDGSGAATVVASGLDAPFGLAFSSAALYVSEYRSGSIVRLAVSRRAPRPRPQRPARPQRPPRPPRPPRPVFNR